MNHIKLSFKFSKQFKSTYTNVTIPPAEKSQHKYLYIYEICHFEIQIVIMPSITPIKYQNNNLRINCFKYKYLLFMFLEYKHLQCPLNNVSGTAVCTPLLLHQLLFTGIQAK
jgi:hypothetical protein